MLAVGAWARLLDDTVAMERPWMTVQSAQSMSHLYCYRIQMYRSLSFRALPILRPPTFEISVGRAFSVTSVTGR